VPAKTARQINYLFKFYFFSLTPFFVQLLLKIILSQNFKCPTYYIQSISVANHNNR